MPHGGALRVDAATPAGSGLNVRRDEREQRPADAILGPEAPLLFGTDPAGLPASPGADDLVPHQPHEVVKTLPTLYTPSMKLPQTQPLLLIAALCATLAACGGSDDEPAPTSPAAPAAATFGDCFALSEGVAYTMSDPDQGGADDATTVVKEAFEGATRTALVEMVNTSTTRSAATYWTTESNGIRFWGDLDYESGVAESKTVHSAGFLLPLNVAAGQSANLSFTDTVTQLTGPTAGQTETIARQATWTFEGFESLTLNGHSFTNTCRVRVVEAGNTEDGPSTFWFARGFGIVKLQHTNTTGQVVESSAVVTVTKSPLEL